VPASLCQDGEKLPWDYSFTRSYGQVGDHAAREKVMENAAAAMAATQAKNQARLDALQAQLMAIVQQQMALNQKRDYAGAEKLQPQLEKTQAEYEKLANEGSAQIDAAGREYHRDLEMSISVRVNADSEHPGNGATQLAKPPGALAAVRWPSANPDVSDDSALYLFGYWRQGPDGIWRSGTRPDVPTSGPHAVSVHVTADRERLADITQQINFAKIAAIVR
jgi:hypothetical protein